MKLTQAFRMAFAAIAGNKMRSFLTMLGIIIGVISVTMLISVGQGATSQVTEQIQGLGSNLITVNINSKKPYYTTVEDLYDLRDTGGVKEVAPLVSRSGTTVKASNTSTTTTIEGTTPPYTDIRGFKIESGRNITDIDLTRRAAVAIVGVEVCDELYGNRNVLGNTMTISGRAFTIVGILEEKGSSMMGSNDNRVIIPYTTAQRLLKQTKITTFYVSTGDGEAVEQAKDTLHNFLMKQVGNEDYFSIFAQTDLLSTMDSVTGTLTLMLGGIAGISLLVGGIGIMNIMLVSVTERTREIGIRKAIGAQRTDILSQFLIESTVISLVGGLLGLMIGQTGVNVLAGLMDTPMSVSAEIALLALGFSMAVGIIFGLYPANKASKLRPIEALRYE